MNTELKARLLSAGTANIVGKGIEEFCGASTAGPGASNSSIFFSDGTGRVRFTLSDGPVTINHHGNGAATLTYEDITLKGYLEKPGFHCPKQAFITVTSACIFNCKYCIVPDSKGFRKTPEQIEDMVKSVLSDINAISLTSGVLTSIEEEESYVAKIVRNLKKYNLPIGVSIFPGINTPEILYDAGACEVKFNLETATEALFSEMCPNLNYSDVISALIKSVQLFGRGHVFSNVILGLSETDDEMKRCIDYLCENGIIPVIRPLTPGKRISHLKRPDPERLLLIHRYLKEALINSKLDTTDSLTMCPACAGCDLIPKRDI